MAAEALMTAFDTIELPNLIEDEPQLDGAL